MVPRRKLILDILNQLGVTGENETQQGLMRLRAAGNIGGAKSRSEVSPQSESLTLCPWTTLGYRGLYTATRWPLAID